MRHVGGVFSCRGVREGYPRVIPDNADDSDMLNMHVYGYVCICYGYECLRLEGTTMDHVAAEELLCIVLALGLNGKLH